jgi:hypothetical protein
MNQDGTWLALGAIGLISATALTRRGSRAGQQIATRQQKFPTLTQTQIQSHITEDGIRALNQALEQVTTSRTGFSRGPAFEFNIKAHSAYLPDWVVHHFGGHEQSGDVISQDAQNELEWLIGDIQDPESPLYQPWFNGDWHTAGRSGGYLILQHHLPDLEDLLDRWGDDARPTLAGPVPSQEYYEEAYEILPEVIQALWHYRVLKRAIAEHVAYFQKRMGSNEEWQERLDLTDAQVAEIKAEMQ